MNKYLKRGLIITLLGIAICAFGLYLKDIESDWYGIILIVGVIIFGVGFVTIVYSLIRKIERQSILEERAEQAAENKE
ncbi:hypothetical protein GCM10023231_32430 [Olivibacter ginsenosidimutans]|uniref:Signal peptidase n=1 Tax=Olivibacter ginsenosidimutans TaxID=1176537 RepID=A0ABP9BVW7_9SPHI